jgi:hypothetical protein
MARILFFIAPMLIIIIAGPLWLSNRRNGASTWFPAQLLVIAGLIVSIVLLHNETFGDTAGSMNLAILTLGPLGGLIVAAIVLPRGPK